jgi:tetratricopeptide (TPR) repeat protein
LLLATAFGAAVVVWVRAVWRSRTVLTGAQRAAAAAVIGLGAASLLDDFSFLPAVMAMAVTLAAWSVPAPDRSATGAPGRLRWALPAGAALIGALVLLPALSVERARLAATEGRQAAIEGRWADAADRFAAAAASHPTNPLDHLGLGLALAEASDLDDARVAYARAQSLSPGDPRVDGALAALALIRDNHEAGTDFLDAASRVSTDPQYAYRLAHVLVESGEVAAGAEAYALAVTLRTDLYALLASNAEVLGRADVRAALSRVAIRLDAVDPERLPPVLWDVALVDGDLSSDAPAAWRAIDAATAGRLNEAARLLDEAREDAPHAQTTHLAAAWVARLACDRDGYDRAMRLAGRVVGGSVPDLAIGRDPIYREPGLGDYQPSWVERPPAAEPWPEGLLDAPECGWMP